MSDDESRSTSSRPSPRDHTATGRAKRPVGKEPRCKRGRREDKREYKPATAHGHARIVADDVVNIVRLRAVSPRVNSDDLIDSQIVADILGLSHRNSVTTYLSRYPEMPRPVVELGAGRVRLWLRPEVERWAAQRQR